MLKALQKLFGQKDDSPVYRLYNSVVTQARSPWFYASLSVPDTLDGRFEMIVLHNFLLMGRLGELGAEGQKLSQGVFDNFTGDMDRNMREMGVGDLGVGKKVKAMARGFFGRVAAYDAALKAQDKAALLDALRRNAYGTTSVDDSKVAQLAEYVWATADSLKSQNGPELLTGEVRWLPTP